MHLVSRRLRLRALAAGVLLLCAGCIARHIRMEQKGLTCGDAHRIAIAAVGRMGYTVTEATRPATGVPGIIVASRQEGTKTRALMVSVVCTGQGAEIEAKPESGGVANVNFPAEFRRSFAAAAANQAPPRPPAAHGLDVLMTLERDGGREQLGVDLSAVGVLPVNVRITNQTARTYEFKADDVVLQNSAGTRVRPLPISELAKKLQAPPAPALQQKILSQAVLKPGETLRGFLLLPFDAYARARVELTDLASGEAEGVAIEL